MDRRTFIFVTLMTISFFGINWYFDMQRAEKYQKEQEAKQAELLKAKEMSTSEIVKRTASLSQLNGVPLFNDQEGTTLLGYGILQGDDVLTLSWDDSLPKQIYFGKKLTPALLVSTDSDQGTPVLYSTDAEKTLLSAQIPQVGTTDVQLLTVSAEPVVYLGRYNDGYLYFPGATPPENAIALIRQGNRYLPAGFYDIKDGSYTPIGDIDDLATRIRYEVDLAGMKEQYYVLENEYMQLVISTLGGAIAEINLPLKSSKDPNSVVLPISFDKVITKKYPQNAQFPSKPYNKAGASGLVQPVTGGYYPLLRRGLVLPQETLQSPARYYALNLVSEDPNMSRISYKVSKFDRNSITLTGSYAGRTITRTYTLPSAASLTPYVFNSSVDVKGNRQGLWLTSGVPETELISGSALPALKYAVNKSGNIAVEQISLPKPQGIVEGVMPEWMSNGNGYFGIILDPDTAPSDNIKTGEVPGEANPSRISAIDHKYDLYPIEKYPGYELLTPLKPEPVPANFRMYTGPYDTATLKTVDATLSQGGSGIGPDYIKTQTFHGWFAFITEPFGKFMLMLMNLFYSFTGSWAASIILLTFAMHFMMYPLKAWSNRSMRKMKEVQPKLDRLKERFKNDPQKLAQEQLKLYREGGGNPFSGCIPTLIQMPFFFGMMDLLRSSFELRGAPFIPGWINNLTEPDVLFSWSYPLPIIGTEFHLLPFLLGIVMYFQFSLMNAGKGKNQNLTDQEKQSQMMGKIMPIMFIFFFYSSASGVSIYFMASIGLGALQQWWGMRTPSKAVATK